MYVPKQSQCSITKYSTTRSNVTIPRECSIPGHDSTRHMTGIHHVRRHTVTGAATLGSSRVMATCGELEHAKEI